jgi:hypothetical protein
VIAGFVTLVMSRFVPYLGDTEMKLFSAPRTGRSPGGFPGQRSRTKGSPAPAARKATMVPAKSAIEDVFIKVRSIGGVGLGRRRKRRAESLEIRAPVGNSQCRHQGAQLVLSPSEVRPAAHPAK